MASKTFAVNTLSKLIDCKPFLLLSLFIFVYRSTRQLGAGQFGTVEQGLWQNVNETVPTEVALKTLNKASSDEDKVKFLQEATIMAQFRHPNVISLHGVVSQGEPVSFQLGNVQL